MTTIPDHVGREAVRLLNASGPTYNYEWPECRGYAPVITVAKLLMNLPAPMTDPDEEAAKRVLRLVLPLSGYTPHQLTITTEQMRKEREAWEAGQP